jgi:ABC-type phosphate transport system substrate-binding protein
VVVVSAKSSVDKLSADQVGQLFLTKTVAFPGGGAATPLDLSEGALHDEFYEKVTGKDQSQLKAYWSKLMFTGKGRPLKAVADSAEVKKQIASNPNAIGYISKSAVDSSVKVVLVP